MAVSEHYLSEVLDCLAQVAPVSYRRVFSGVSIYHRGVQFALIANDRLYFRVDEASVELYRARDMRPLQPEAALSSARPYYEVPQVVLNTPGELLFWMRAAVEAAPNPAEQTALHQPHSSLPNPVANSPAKIA